MNNSLIVSSSPHIKSPLTTRRVMLDVILALVPTTVAGVVIFGLRSLLVLLACVASAVLAEFVFNILAKKEETVGDLSAALTGLLLALNLNADVPVWQCVLGSVFAIVVVKCFFGGLGCNFANPAITGRIFLLLCFAGTVGVGAVPKIVDLTATATPLSSLNAGSLEAAPSLWKLFLGLHGGAIGEVCAPAILLGFIYLAVRRIIYFETPLIFIGTVFLGALILTNDPIVALAHVLAGGLLLGAVFMATDYVTTPITRTGRMIFAFGCGIITVLIRFFGNYPEGVSFAILFMNILSPFIEKWTAKTALGGNRA